MGGDWGGDGRYMQQHRPPVNPRQGVGQPGAQARSPQRPPAGNRPRPPARPRRKKRRGGRIFGVIVLVIVLLLAGLWLYVDFSLNRVSALGDYSGRPAQGAGTNWLIVGSDSRQGLTAAQAAKLHTGNAAAAGGQRTDSIMLLHLPDNSTKPTLVSLLRDSYVSIPGHGKGKINSAFSYGGPQLLTETVEQATGLRIDHYAEIGFGGFASVVDDVGGVNMCLKQPVKDPYAGLNLPAGCQDMNGPTALSYVRSRHAFAAGDYARTEHQREFIGTLANKIASPGVMLNPFKAVPLLLDLPKALTVANGDHLQNLIGMAWDVRGISSGGVVTTGVPISGHHGGSDLLWDQSQSQQMFHDLNHDQALPASLVTNH
ncbi:MAG: LCP family protein [Sciscionella sp.]